MIKKYEVDLKGSLRTYLVILCYLYVILKTFYSTLIITSVKIMTTSDVHFFISVVDKLVFSHRKKHLGDLEQAVLEGSLNQQKYAEIAKNNYRSEKYIKDVAGKLWQSLSGMLGEQVNKSNIRSSLQRHYSAHSSPMVSSTSISYAKNS